MSVISSRLGTSVNWRSRALTVAISGIIALAACAWGDRAEADTGACFGPWGSPRNLNDHAYWLADNGDTQPCGDQANNSQCVNTGSADMHPAISPDGLSLYISSNRSGTNGDFDIWVSRWDSTTSAWGPVHNLGPTINSAEAEWAPNISPDGHWLLFTRAPTTGNPRACPFDPVTGEAYDPTQCQYVWVSYRKDVTDDAGWGKAKPLSNKTGTINDPNYDTNAPRLFINPNTGDVSIYFNSCLRSGAGNCSPTSKPNFDDYVSTWSPPKGASSNTAAFLAGSSFPTGWNLVELNSSSRDTPTDIRSDGLEFSLTSNRSGSLGTCSVTNTQSCTVSTGCPAGEACNISLDLWSSTRTVLVDEHNDDTVDEGWATPTNLNFDAVNDQGQLCSTITDPVALTDCLNSTYNDGAPALSSDGTTLYFYSERPAPTNKYTDCSGVGAFGSHCRNLWTATRARVTCTGE
jgi:hypothetical protein